MSTDRQMHKEVVVPIYNGILLSGTNLVRWIDLEPVTQSEVSQKKKNGYCILMHIYGI